MRKVLLSFILFCVCLPSLKGEEGTLVCIHGFIRRPGCMKRIARPFERLGYRTHLWGYPSRQRTIEEHAGMLAVDLRKIAASHPGQPIDFVTHSLGGIVLRAALNHPYCPEEAKQGRAVLLSPPNQGSSFGRRLGRIKGMRTIVGKHSGTQLLEAPHFDHLGPFPPTMDVCVISGTFGWNPWIEGPGDGVVGVDEAQLSTPHEHLTASCLHSFMMKNREVIQQTLGFLTQRSSLS